MPDGEARANHSLHAPVWYGRLASVADTTTEMKYIVAAMYSGYSTTIVDDTGIEQVDAYTAPPRSHELLIKLQKTGI